MLMRGETVQAQHQQHPQAHAQDHGKCRRRAVAGDFTGSVQARQDQRERTGGEHHAGGKPEHYILAACADVAQHHRQQRAQGRGGKPGHAAEQRQVQVVGMLTVDRVPHARRQQRNDRQQAQAQAGT
ncbi:hypothetical protein D3C76_1160710 [compost metagenome]